VSVLLVAVLLAGLPATAAGWSPFQLSLSPQVQVVGPDTAVHGLRLSLPWGDNAEVNGLELGFYKTPADGVTVQCAGVSAQGEAAGGLGVSAFGNVGGFSGIQVSGVFAVSGWALDEAASIEGVQLAGVFTETGAVSGAQIGGLVACASRVAGLQFGGWTVAADEVRGGQLGGLTSGAARVDGLQLSAAVDLARSLRGVQLSGLTNVAGDMAGGGMQVSAVNVVERGRGFQLGVVNAGRDFNGLQIGVLNIIRNGPIPVMPIVNFGWGGDVDSGPAGEAGSIDKQEFIGASIIAPVAAAVVSLYALLIAYGVSETGSCMVDDWF